MTGSSQNDYGYTNSEAPFTWKKKENGRSPVVKLVIFSNQIQRYSTGRRTQQALNHLVFFFLLKRLIETTPKCCFTPAFGL
jgi:hypothetical protein